MGRWLRRLRGALGNAVVWGMGWFAAGFPITAGLFAAGVVTGGGFWPIALSVAQGLGVTGFFMGGLFSAYLGVAGRNQTLEELSPWRLAAAGVVIGGLGFPAFAIATSGWASVSGAWAVIGVVSGISAALAGTMALGTIKVAQSGLAASRRGAAVGRGSGDLLPPVAEDRG